MPNEIARAVKMIEADQENIGLLSTEEVIAAAFLFNRMGWLPSAYLHPLEAIERLGSSWIHMVQEYHLLHRR